MKRFSVETLLLIAMDCALLAASLYHVPYLLERPAVPFVLRSSGEVIVVDGVTDTPAAGLLQPGDTISAMAGVPLSVPGDAEFLADFRTIGEAVDVTVVRQGTVGSGTVRLVPFFSVRYVVVCLIVGVATWGVALFVILRAKKGRTASVIHFALLCMGIGVMMMRGATPVGDPWSVVSRGLYFLAYMGVAVFFLYFTTLFPVPMQRRARIATVWIFMPASLVLLTTLLVHLASIVNASTSLNAVYQFQFGVFRGTVVVYVILGVANFIRSYRRAVSPEEQKKLQWILWGLTIGPLPFLLLEVLIEYLLPVSPVPEEYTLLFLLAVPVSFAISFLRYHVLDVQVVINRTTVYGLVLAVLVAGYIILIAVASLVIGRYTTQTFAAAAVVIGLAFEPVRRRVQSMVDRRFFRVRYDYRQALRNFTEEMKRRTDARSLAALLVSQVQQLIPVRAVALCGVREGGGGFEVLAELPDGVMGTRAIVESLNALISGETLPHALSDRIEAGVRHVPADSEALRRAGVTIIVPLRSKDGTLLGIVALGDTLSGSRFSSEDVDLLVNMGAQTALELERILLQQSLYTKELEAQRLRELNDIKSEFVSYVSHELKTPLTSIKIFTELLEKRAQSRDTKSREFLRYIEGESDRLNRMVETILDTTRIEKGVMTYHFARQDLGEVVRHVLRTMSYQLENDHFQVRTSGMGRRARYPFWGDRDAVVQALTNLIANAIKYSDKRRVVKVSLGREGKWWRCLVEDRGRGIPASAIPNLFEKFYRVPGSTSQVDGMGLGLSLVKNILEAHNGKVVVTSVEGKGSAFRLFFPRHNIMEETP